MSAIDLGQVGQLSALRLVAARACMELEKGLGNNEYEMSRFIFRKAEEFISEVIKGHRAVTELQMDHNAAGFVSQYGVAKRAWRAADVPELEEEEEVDDILRHLAEECQNIAEGGAVDPDRVMLLREFFRGLSAYTRERLDETTETSPDPSGILGNTAHQLCGQ